MKQPLIYVDYAAATPMDERVLSAMYPYFSEKFYNPSATYLPAMDVVKDLNAARTRIAYWLGARPSEIIFTAGGTEANNLALQGVMRNYPGANLVVSVIEHESVLMPAAQFESRLVQVDARGMLDMEHMRACIDDQTVLVSIMYANNEVGTVEPIREVTQMVAAIRATRRKQGNTLPLYVHTDACQAANYLDLHVARLGVDLMTLNGGKIYGPKQSGILFIKSGVYIAPLVFGGGQERGLRSGTENVAASIGLSVALDLAQTARQKEADRLQKLQQYFFAEINKKIPQAIVNGSKKKRLPNNVHLTIPGVDNERLLVQLDEAGILAAAGSACSASNEEPSHVLRAMGLSDKEAQASVRFSMGKDSDGDAIDQIVAAMVRFLD